MTRAEELEAIRERKEWADQNPDPLSDMRALRVAIAEADRAFLLAEVERLRGRLKQIEHAAFVEGNERYEVFARASLDLEISK